MSIVLNIRGTNGSGKSTAVRLLMEKMGTRSPFQLDGKEAGYRFATPAGKVFVMGKYTTACGGMDSSFSYKGAADDVVWLVHELSASGHVVAEGVIALGSYGFGRLTKLAADLEAQGHHMIFALMDTPLDVCITRCEARRAEKAAAKGKDPKPLDPHNLESKWDATHKDHERLGAAGLDCRLIPYQDPLPTILSWLGL